MILLNKNGQRLGDLAACFGCVIDENPKTGVQNTLIVDIPTQHQPKYEEVRLFSDEDMQKIKKFLPMPKKPIIISIKIALAKKLAEKMKVEPDEKPHLFIKRVLADYTYYTSKDSI